MKLNKGIMQGYEVYDNNGISKALTSNSGGLGGKTGLYKVNASEKNSTGKQKQDNYVIEQDTNYQIRRLTPVECERLQGFPDRWTEFGKDGETISDTQRYKCLGNAVTTNVITAIVDEMFEKGDDWNDWK